MDENELAKLWTKTLVLGDPQFLSVGATFGRGAEERLTVPSRAGTVAGSTTGSSAPAPLRTATYEAGDELGRGGMGVVQRARQKSLLRYVAIKRIISGTNDLEARERFEAEALVTARLDHPNVVPVHDLSVDADGNPFLAMKLVSGTPWSRLLHPTTPDERARAAKLEREGHLEILSGVSNAVACAHSRGILHRDLKPENVMVGEFGEVLVLDWGLAVQFGDVPEAERIAPHVSEVDAPAGTPSYMAPELADARGDEQGPWTDVYLLGAILHEILTGEPPHRGGSFFRVLAAASESAPPRFADTVPAELQEICRRALSARPRSRYASVAEFKEALQAQAKHRESLRISDAARAALGAARQAPSSPAATSQVYASYAEALALARQAQVLWDGNETARGQLVAARAGYSKAALDAGDVALARTHADELPPDAPERRDLVARVDAAERARSVALWTRRILLVAVLVLVIIIAVVGALYVRQQAAAREQERRARVRQEELRERAEKFLDLVMDDVSVQLMGTRPDLVELLNRKTLEYYEELAREGVTGRAREGLARRLAMVAMNGGKAALERDDLDGALAAFEKSEKIGREAKRDDDVATALSMEGDVYVRKGDVDHARERYTAACALSRKFADASPGDDWWQLVTEEAYERLVGVERRRHDLDAALEAARACLTVARRALEGGASPQHLARVAMGERDVGDVLLERGDKDGALASFQDMLGLAEKLQVPDTAQVEWSKLPVEARRRVATVLGQKNDREGALATAKKAVEYLGRYRRVLPDDPWPDQELAFFGEQNARVQRALSDEDGARESLASAMAALRRLRARDPDNAQWKAWLERLDKLGRR